MDGTGNPGYYADIGIRGERIIEIGTISEDFGKHVINAKGLHVSPDPEGLHFVIVNGKVAVQEGEVLRKNGELVIYGHGKGDE